MCADNEIQAEHGTERTVEETAFHIASRSTVDAVRGVCKARVSQNGTESPKNASAEVRGKASGKYLMQEMPGQAVKGLTLMWQTPITVG